MRNHALSQHTTSRKFGSVSNAILQLESERAKRAEKASCGETVVQKGVLESPFLLCQLKVFRCFKIKP